MRHFTCVVALFIWVLTSSLSALAAETEYLQSTFNGSLAKYLDADGDAVKAVLQARPLDPSLQFDSEILALMKVLNEIN